MTCPATGCWPAPPLGTKLIGPGHVRAPGSGETVLGSLGPLSHAERTVSSLASAGIAARVTADPLAVILAKVAFNCVMNQDCVRLTRYLPVFRT
jgi:ketopantoate reductase